MSLPQLISILLARLWVIAAVILAVVGSALVASMLMPPKYTAETSVIVDIKSADPVGGAFMPTQMAPGYMATQVDIIRSDRVARRVVETTRMHELPAVQDQWLEATNGEGEIEVWLAKALKSQIEVFPSRDSSVVTLAYSGRDPAFVARIANAFAEAYIATTLELKVEPAREYAAWFDERTRSLRNELELAQRRLSGYEQEHGIVATEGRLDLETARLVELSTQLVTVQGQRADSRSRQSQAGAGDALPEVMQNPLISSLKGELSKKEAERRQISGRVGPNHPDLARINSEIASMRERLAEEIQRIARSLDTTTLISSATEAEVAAAVKQQHARVLELKSHRDQIAVLQRDVESAQNTHDLVAQRLAHTSLESLSQQTNVSVLTEATPPLYAAGPRKLVILALAGMVGGLLGIAAALLLEFRDPRLRRSDQLAPFCGAPLLGVIPDTDRPGASAFRTSPPAAA